MDIASNKKKISLVGGRFYQNVRRILRYWRKNKENTRAMVPDDVVEFTSVLTLDAPGQEVESLQPPNELDIHYKMAVNHFGLLGTFGALPLRYTEWLIDRRYRYGDESAQAFINIFNHRLLSLRFQAWQKCRLYVNAELNGREAFPVAIQAVAGRLAGSDTTPINPIYAGLLAASVRSLTNLQHLLHREFLTSVQIRPFQGRWQPIDVGLRCQLGQSSLGESPMLGDHYWDIQSGFNIRLGPIAAESGYKFMPGNTQHRCLMQWVKEYSGSLISFSLELLILHSKVNNTLDGQGKLGWNSCLGEWDNRKVQSIFIADELQQLAS